MTRHYRLDNGIKVVCEQIPYLRSVSMGIWVKTGSRKENGENNGISHLIEHMMFKGTQKRSARDIAAEIDGVGGIINAFTGKEHTCFYTKTLDEHINTGVDVLSDIFFNSLFRERDIELEKQVILEEINMYQDTPDELVHEVHAQVMWEGSPLGRPILGTRESLNKISQKSIIDYIDANYGPDNTVIALAGNYEEGRLIDELNKNFGQWKNPIFSPVEYGRERFNNRVRSLKKETEQVHLCMGFEGLEYGNDDLYSLLTVNNYFGGSMSSVLFQKIREERGLVYSIYSYPSTYEKNGSLSIYAGMNPDQYDNVIQLIREEVSNLMLKKMNKESILKSKEQFKGNYILGLESTNSRMIAIGKSQLALGYVRSPDEILAKIDRVNEKHVNDIIERIFDINRMSFCSVGNIKGM